MELSELKKDCFQLTAVARSKITAHYIKLIKDQIEWVSDKAGEWTELLNHEWISVKKKKKEATQTQQGLGEQHLQSTVNMGNEQSGLFPLGLYSRGNEKKTREMMSHWEIKGAGGHCTTANANYLNEWRKRKNESNRAQRFINLLFLYQSQFI